MNPSTYTDTLYFGRYHLRAHIYLWQDSPVYRPLHVLPTLKACMGTDNKGALNVRRLHFQWNSCALHLEFWRLTVGERG